MIPDLNIHLKHDLFYFRHFQQGEKIFMKPWQLGAQQPNTPSSLAA